MTGLLPQAVGLITALTYAASIISARRGLQYSNATTVTYLSLLFQTVTLWTLAFLVTGIPAVGKTFLLAAVLVGFLMPMVRLLTYTGIAKVGAARGAALRSTHPLFSAMLALAFLGETATAWGLTGVLLVVAGIVLISWREEGKRAPVPWWHNLYSILAAVLAALVHNLVRFSLHSAGYPILFAAIVGFVSLATFTGYLRARPGSNRPLWSRRAMAPFLATAALENLGFLLFNVALSIGPVVLVTPMVATQPMWVLLFTVAFLRSVELVTPRTAAGSAVVVAGTVAITLGGS